MHRLPGGFVVGLSLIAVLAVGCKQELGERCEQDSDCATGLECNREGPHMQGRCIDPNARQPDASVGDNDAGMTEDMDAGSDAADDAPAGTDASDDAPMASDDASMSSDAVTTDAVMTSDAVTSDAAPEVSVPADGAVDATVD